MIKSFFAVGSRKNATAKVWLVPEQDRTSVNNKTLEDYFGRADLVRDALAPLKVTGTADRFGMKCRVQGGGHSAQATAISLGAARALVAFNPDLRIQVRADELVHYKTTKDIMIMCAELGAIDLIYSTFEELE